MTKVIVLLDSLSRPKSRRPYQRSLVRRAVCGNPVTVTESSCSLSTYEFESKRKLKGGPSSCQPSKSIFLRWRRSDLR